jgi:hypothetical protein
LLQFLPLLLPCCSRFRSRVYIPYGCGPPFSIHFHFTVVCYLKVCSTLTYLNIPFLVYLVLLLVLVPVWQSCCGSRYCIYTFFVLGWSRPAVICLLSPSYGVVFGWTPKLVTAMAEGSNFLCELVVGMSLSKISLSLLLGTSKCVSAYNSTKYHPLSEHSYSKPRLQLKEFRQENRDGIWISGLFIAVLWF